MNLDDIFFENVPDELLDLRYKDIDIWPLIKIKLGAVRENLCVNATKSTHRAMPKFNLKSWLNMLGNNYEVLTLSNVATRSSLYQSKRFAANFDTVIMKQDQKNCINFEYGYSSIESFLPVVSGLELVVKVIQKIQSLFSEKIEVLDFLENHNELRTYKKDLIKYVRTVYALSLFWSFLLRMLKVKKVFISNYANALGQSLIVAAVKNGIECYDVQHGVQGQSHFSYRGFKKNSYIQYNTLPSRFMCWNEASASNIKSWLPDPSYVSIIGIPSLESDIKDPNTMSFPKASSEINILFSLSRLDDLNFLSEIITRYPTANYLIRLHPTNHEFFDRVEESISEKFSSYRNKIYVKEPTFANLIDVLNITDLHVTLFSSVAIEASFLSIKTVFIDKAASDMYPDLLKDGIAELWIKDS